MPAPMDKIPTVERVCEEIIAAADRGEIMTLGQACRTCGVSRVTLWRWRKDDPEIDKALCVAQEQAADAAFEYLNDIVMNADRDADLAFQTEFDAAEEDGDEKGKWRRANRAKHESFQQTKLRVDVLKWMLAKMHPERYADRARVDLTTPKRVEVT